MKQLCIFSMFLLVFAVNPAKAQQIKTEVWPELQTVIEVSDRIDHNIKNNNPKAIAHFSESLLQHTEALVKSTPPASFKQQAAQAKSLLKLAEELVEQKSASESVQMASFEKFQKTLAKVKNTK